MFEMTGYSTLLSTLTLAFASRQSEDENYCLILISPLHFNRQQRRGLKSIGGTVGSCNLPADRCKFPTEEIMGAKNFNVAPKFS